jgi:hypothetical protein
MARTTATFSYAPFYGARHDRSGIPRGQASEGSLTRWRSLRMLGAGVNKGTIEGRDF